MVWIALALERLVELPGADSTTSAGGKTAQIVR
jgi:hypothetical protein